MTSDNSHDTVDSWSRFVSYCSLVVAVSALAWVLFGFGNLANWRKSSSDGSLDSAVFNARYEREVEKRNVRDEEIRDQWKQQQAEQLNDFTEAANKLLDEHQQLVSKLQVGSAAKESYTALLEEGKANATDGDDNADGDDTGNKLASQEIPLLPITTAEDSADNSNEDIGGKAVKDQLFRPLLAYVRESLKPETGANAALLTIRNRGSRPAVVARVEFTPSVTDESIFEVSPSASVVSAGDDKDTLSIVFSEKDNRAAGEGKHGVYARDLSDAHVVPAASDVRIRLTVANSKHVGWGFHGTVTLEYNGLEPLTIEDAQLIFVAADDTIRRQ